VLRPLETYERSAQLLAAQVGASEWEVSAALKVFERQGAVARGMRGEGRYGITVMPSSANHHPRSAEAKALLSALVDAAPPGAKFSTELYMLARRSGLQEEQVRHALTLLERAGIVLVARPFAGRALSILKHDSWRDLDLDLNALRAQERNQLLLLKRMTDYAYTKRCRRGYLLRYFGEDSHLSNSCGACDVCVGPKLKLSTRTAKTANGPTGERVLPARYSNLAAEALKKWRRELSQDLGMPPFIIFNDATLYGLAAALPTTRDTFLQVKGTGESRWERFGAAVTKISVMARAAGEEPQAVATVTRAKRRR
jgi:ATP-dependent DNA helicase RecQ